MEFDRFDPSADLVLVTGLCALLAATIDGVWRWARNVVTIVHEGGHAVVAVLTGRRLTGIKLHADTSGLTVSAGRPTGPGMVLTAAAGYLSPSVVGLAGVALLAVDQVTVMLWTGAAVLVAMLVMVRNVYGAFALLLTGAVVVAISLWATAGVQARFGYTMTWFLLIGAVRPVAELRRQRRRQPGRRSDADHLARLTGVPATVWVYLFGLATLTALAGGAWLLLT
ncbi:MAG: M50 family metallopeptidase [Acidimicrobiales bacterium]